MPLLGAPLVAILLGMLLALILGKSPEIKPGVDFAAKKILQYAIILLGFGLNLSLLLQTGRHSLLVILGTITAGLLTAFLLQKIIKLPGKISTLIGVGSAICGGSAIAATAPVIEAEEDEVASAISVVVFFNVLAVFIFPLLGNLFSMTPEQFGIFAGSAINDTSSVTAAASIWDTANNLGMQTLDTAVTVKLIRTLAIIPITLYLSYRSSRPAVLDSATSRRMTGIPTFILWFLAAAIIATLVPIPAVLINLLRAASRFMIVMAMTAIGLKTNIIKLVKTSDKPLLLGLSCSLAIIATSLLLLSYT